MTPLILDKEENGDDTDNHGAGNEDDDDQVTVHVSNEVNKIYNFWQINVSPEMLSSIGQLTLTDVLRNKESFNYSDSITLTSINVHRHDM